MLLVPGMAGVVPFLVCEDKKYTLNCRMYCHYPRNVMSICLEKMSCSVTEVKDLTEATAMTKAGCLYDLAW
jgi:hypothetical protein